MIKKFNETFKGDKATPTAVEFCQNFDADPDDDFFYKAMIEFAKLHVTAALKASHRNNQLPNEDLDYTLSSYPLDKIK